MATPTQIQPRKERQTFHLTRAKIRTLESLAEYFCLRTNDLALLLRGRTPNDNDQRTVRRTLGLLFKAGLVYRIPFLELGRERGGITYAYGLSDKGVNACKSLYANAKTFDDHSQRTLDHELEISLFHIAIKQFSAKHNLKLYWQQDDLKCTINPDAMFAITDPARPEGKNTLYYFLEMERAKIGHYVDGEPSIMRKLGKYHAYYGSDACQKEWNFRQYRVIVVQRTEERRANLLRELNREFNHRMFWLTTEELCKKDIGIDIFKTPKDHVTATYSFLEMLS